MAVTAETGNNFQLMASPHKSSGMAAVAPAKAVPAQCRLVVDEGAGERQFCPNGMIHPGFRMDTAENRGVVSHLFHAVRCVSTSLDNFRTTHNRPLRWLGVDLNIRRHPANGETPIAPSERGR